jgi:hypothetical protein
MPCCRRGRLICWHCVKANSVETTGNSVCRVACRRSFEFRCVPRGHFARSRTLRPDSAETYGNPARRTRAEKRVSFRGRPERHLSVDAIHPPLPGGNPRGKSRARRPARRTRHTHRPPDPPRQRARTLPAAAFPPLEAHRQTPRTRGQVRRNRASHGQPRFPRGGRPVN